MCRESSDNGPFNSCAQIVGSRLSQLRSAERALDPLPPPLLVSSGDRQTYEWLGDDGAPTSIKRVDVIDRNVMIANCELAWSLDWATSRTP